MKRTIIQLLMLLPLALPGAAEVGSGMLPGESLVLNVYASGMSPVAIRTQDGGFREVPDDQQADRIRAIVDQYFKPGQAFELYRNGQSAGELKVSEFNPAGCFGFGFISGVIQPPFSAQDQSARAVAFTSGFPGRRTYAGSAAVSEPLRQQALALSRKIYAERGAKPAEIARLQIDAVQGLRFDQGKQSGVMLATRLAAEPGDAVGCHSHHLLLVAEQQGEGLQPRLELLKKATQAEGMCSGYTFVSSFEAEPGSEYLLVEGFGYEWNWYEIFRRTPTGTFEQDFSGGGGGC